MMDNGVRRYDGQWSTQIVRDITHHITPFNGVALQGLSHMVERR